MAEVDRDSFLVGVELGGASTGGLAASSGGGSSLAMTGTDGPGAAQIQKIDGDRSQQGFLSHAAVDEAAGLILASLSNNGAGGDNGPGAGAGGLVRQGAGLTIEPVRAFGSSHEANGQVAALLDPARVAANASVAEGHDLAAMIGGLVTQRLAGIETSTRLTAASEAGAASHALADQRNATPAGGAAVAVNSAPTSASSMVLAASAPLNDPLFTVSTAAELESAITAIDSGGADAATNAAYTIDITGPLDLSTVSGGLLTAINLDSGSSLTIAGTDGSGGAEVQILDGEGSAQGLFVFSGTVTIEDLTIEDTVARGGNGGNGGVGDVIEQGTIDTYPETGGGGGGAGLGGGLFVAAAGAVTLDDVTFADDAAKGGAGGEGSGQADFGDFTVASGGGGGLGGDGGNGPLLLTPSDTGAGGADYPGTDIGAGESGAFDPTYNSIIGGPYSLTAGFGGGGSGGIAGPTVFLQQYGANGGFGGGGGGGAIEHYVVRSDEYTDVETYSVPAGSGGFGGNDGVQGPGELAVLYSGGGGLGAGGDVFVQQGGSLTIEGGSLSGGSVKGGGGYGSSVAGAYGSGIFIQGNETVAFAPLSGQTLTIADVIADMTGSHDASGQTGAGAVAIDGSGTVVLSATNTYTGGTTLEAGALDLTAVGAAGSGAITFLSGSTDTLAIANGALASNALANAIFDFAVGDTLDLTGLSFVQGQTTATLSGSALTVTNGATAETLTLKGLTSAAFTTASDGNGGTLVQQPTIVHPAPTLTNAAPAKVGHGKTIAVGSAVPGLVGDTLSLFVDTAPADGALSVVNDAVDYTQTGSVPAGGTTDTFSYQVEDQLGQLSNTVTATVTLDPGPTAANGSATEGHGQTVNLTALVNGLVTAGLTGDTETLTNVSAASGTASLGADNVVTYTAPASGSDTVNYTVTDQVGDAASGQVAVTVDPGPNAAAGSVAVGSGQTVNLTALIAGLVTPGIASDSELLTSISAASGTALSGNAGITYTAPTSGPDTISYTVEDQYGDTASGQVAVSVGVATSLSNGALFTVSTGAELESAITAIDSGGADAATNTAYTIDITGPINLSGASDNLLTAINLDSGSSLTIAGTNGSGGAEVQTLDGEGVAHGLFVFSGTVAIEDLTIEDTVAQGGNGGMGGFGGTYDGSGGGGGGAGLGGGLFVATAGDVTLDDVAFINDAAHGGAGSPGSGIYTHSAGAIDSGGGGGMGGNGANGTNLAGSTGNGAGGADYPGTDIGAGESGVDVLESRFHSAGFGGGGSGGIGSFDQYGGNGGFGGGGGGGGITGLPGDVEYSPAGSRGFGGGNGNTGSELGSGDNGGGGLGAGGDVFVQQGGSLTIEGGSLSGGRVVGGGASSGKAYGSGIFIQGNETVAFAPLSEETLTVGDVIADMTGSHDASGQTGAGAVVIDGSGTVVLSATNTYTGGTTLEAGTLDLTAAGAAGSGAITFLFGSTEALAIANGALTSNALANAIDGFARGDSIDLTGLSFVQGQTTATLSGSTLTVTNGAAADTLTLNGLTDVAFTTASDGDGGTLVQQHAAPALTSTAPAEIGHGQSVAVGSAVAGVAGYTLTLAPISGPADGTLSLVDGSTIDYTAESVVPAGGTTDTFSYQVEDQLGGLSNTVTTTVTLDPGPTAANGSATEGHNQTVDLTSLIDGLVTPGIAGDTETLTSVSASSGTAVLGADNAVTYTAPASGSDTISYTVADQLGDTASGQVAVTVDPGPTAADGSVTEGPGQTVDLTALIDGLVTPGVAGDTDILIGVSAASGTAVLGFDNTVTYTAPASGTDTITYTVADQLGDTASGQVAVTVGLAVAPTISGTVAGQTTNSERPVEPFTNVTIGDANSGATDTLTISLSNDGAGGTLAGTGLTSDGSGVYTLGSSAPGTVTTELNALTFTPVAGQPASRTTTTFTLSDLSSDYATTAVDSTTTVEDIDAGVVPTISGTVAGQTTTSEAPIEPFANVTITDANAGDPTENLTIKLEYVKGTLPAGGTLTGNDLVYEGDQGGIDTYQLSGAAGTVTSELDALTFTPVVGQPRASATTLFALTDFSSADIFAPAVNSSTTVEDIDPAVAPTISGTVAGQTTVSEAPVDPFANVTIGDANAGNPTETLLITLEYDGETAPTLSGAGLNDNGTGPGTVSYYMIGAAGTVTAELDALTFTPAAGAVGSSATTTFELFDFSSAHGSASDSTTTVTDIDPGVAPTISGTVAGQTATSETPVEPFTNVTIGDTNSGTTDTLTISLSNDGAGGALSGNGLASDGSGVYTLSGAAGTVTTELDGLTFTPVAESSETTFTLSDLSSAYATATADSTTTVTVDLGPTAADGSVTEGHGQTADLTALIGGLVTPGIAGDTETLTSVSASSGTAVLGADNAVTYTAPASGPDTISYTVADQYGDAASGQIAVTVDPGPTAANASVTEGHGQTVSLTALIDGLVTPGIAGDTETVTSVSAAQGAVVFSTVSTAITYAAPASGPDTISYTVADQLGDTASGQVAVTVDPGPTAANASVTEGHGQTVNLTALINGLVTPGIAGDTETVTSVSAAQGAVVFSTVSTAITYAAPASGPDTISYTVADQYGDTASGQVAVTVDPGPTAANASVTEGHGQTVNLTALINGLVTPGIAGDTETVTSVSAAQGAVVFSTVSTAITYGAPASGPDTISYTVADQYGDTASGQVAVTVDPGPTAANASVTEGHGQTVNLTALINGLITPGLTSDTETVTSVSAAQGAVVFSTVSTAITYAAPASGPDTISYTVADQYGDTASGQVAVTVDPGPTAANASVTEGHGQTVNLTALINGLITPGLTSDTETLTSVSAASGTAVLGADNALTYTAPASGPDTISYTVADQYGDTASGQVAVTVDPGPTAANASVTEGHGQTVNLTALINGLVTAGITSDTETLTSVSAASGTAVLGADNAVTYAAPASGPDTISYTVADQLGDTASGQVAVTVDPGPTAANASVTEGHGQTVNLTALINGLVTAGITSDTETLTSVSAASGTAVLGADNAVTYAAPASGPDTISYTVADQLGDTASGQVAVTVDPGPTAANASVTEGHGQTVSLTALINGLVTAGITRDTETLTSVSAASGTAVLGADNAVTYTAPASGPDTISYTVADQLGDTASGQVAVTVDPGPTAANASVTEGHGQTVSLTALIDGLIAPGVAGDTETLTSVSAAHGTAVLGDGNAVTYTAPATGSDTISYTVTDQYGETASGQVAVTVDPGPTAANASVTEGHGQTVSLTALIDGLITAGVAGDVETLTKVSATHGTAVLGAGDAVTYTAPASGRDTISYTVADQYGETASGQVAVTVDPGPTLTSTAPSKIGRGQTAAVGKATAGLAGDTLSLVVYAPPSDGALSLLNGAVSYAETGNVPAGGATDTFSYQVEDQYGDLSKAVTTTLLIDPGPTAADSSVTEGHGQTVSLTKLINGLVTRGLAGDTETLTKVIAASGTVVLGAKNAVTYTAPAIGPDTISYTVTDQLGDTASGQVAVTVDPGPTAANASVTEGHGQTVSLTTLINGLVAPGIAGDAETLTKVSATLGKAALGAKNAVTYTAPTSGPDTISYTVEDQYGDAASGQVAVTVDPGPTAANASVTEGHGQTVSLTALINGLITAGVAGDAETLTKVSATRGKAALGANNAVTYTAPASGPDTISYTVADQHGDAASGQVAVTVDPGPTLTSTAPSKIGRGQTAAVGKAAAGLAGDTLSLIVDTAPSDGALSLLNGAISYAETGNVPVGGATDTFSYQVEDQYGDLSKTVTTTLSIDPGPIAANASVIEGRGQTVNLTKLINGLVTPGLAGDAEILTSISAASGTAVLGAENAVTYTAPASGPDTISYTVTDQLGDTASGQVAVTVDPGPSAANASVTEGHGKTVSLTTLINGLITAGLPGDVETLTKVSAAHGKAALGAKNAVTYTAPASGPDTISYTVEDQYGDAASGQVAVTVDPGPTAAKASVTEGHSQTVNLTALINGLVTPGIAGDAETLTKVSAARGTAALGADNAVTYTAPASGRDTISYTVADQYGETASGQVAVTIDPGPTLTSTAPSKIGRGQTTAVGKATAGLAGDTLSLLVYAPPSDGALSLLNGAVSYAETGNVPAGGATDTFSYQVEDQYGDLSKAVTTTLSIDPALTASHALAQSLDLAASGSSALSPISSSSLFETTGGTSALAPNVADAQSILFSSDAPDLQGSAIGSKTDAISTASSLGFDSTVAPGQAIDSSGGGALDLIDPQHLGSDIDIGGFAVNESIDFASWQPLTSLSETSAGTPYTLALSNGTNSLSLNPVSDNTVGDFNIHRPQTGTTTIIAHT